MRGSTTTLASLALAALLIIASSGIARAELQETPSLVPEVASGALPPVAKRIPNEPALAT